MSCNNCCLEVQLSCCNDVLAIQTYSTPGTVFEWELTDDVGNLYTGTDTVDLNGLLSLTGLPEGFLYVPARIIKIKLDKPALVLQEYDCFEVDIISGAYLALPVIGESLPLLPPT